MNTLIKNTLNAHEFPKNYRVITGPDMAIPDQSLSLREIVNRYTRGLPIPEGNAPVFEGEEGNGIDPRTLDLSEQHELLQQTSNQLFEHHEKRNRKKAPQKTLPPPKADEGGTSTSIDEKPADK